MRLTSDMWASAFVRRVFGDGGYAAIVRRGDPQAGAIFIVALNRDGTWNLYAPAPQSLAANDGTGGRSFTLRLECAAAETVEKALAAEMRFDGDLWQIECEGLAAPFDSYATLVSEG